MAIRVGESRPIADNLTIEYQRVALHIGRANPLEIMKPSMPEQYRYSLPVKAGDQRQLGELTGAACATLVAEMAERHGGLDHREGARPAEHVEAVHGPEDAARYAIPRLRHEQREHFVAMLLDRRNHILAMRDVSIGSQSASVVHPREVFRLAIQHSAASLIVLHNHPSGDPTPSQEDVAVTQRLVDAGRIMDIPVLDHIVLGGDKFISLKEEGMVQ
mgnify:CR=1 FL=1